MFEWLIKSIMVCYCIFWSGQYSAGSRAWDGGGGGVGGGHPNPEKRGGGGLRKKIFSTVRHQYGLKIRGAGSLDPSLGSVTAIMRGRIIMAMRTVYVEYCKLPLISLPTFKPFPPLMSPATRKRKNTSNTEIQICDPYCFNQYIN